MKKFEIGKTYTEKNYYDGDTTIWTMKVLKRTPKTLTAEITLPSGKTETITRKINEFIDEETFKRDYIIFGANSEM